MSSLANAEELESAMSNVVRGRIVDFGEDMTVRLVDFAPDISIVPVDFGEEITVRIVDFGEDKTAQLIESPFHVGRPMDPPGREPVGVGAGASSSGCALAICAVSAVVLGLCARHLA